ncbi:unnamed protein product [Symbiodinium natans]|uniref:Uncharacterized protein n=1 Tax=Symbiodinium natans TaxID=878477 RepID=A0A812KHS0_9DINO|nr:unnamed protein product [Symbiodinium natans]
MPTILESLVGTYLGANLDEKASSSLLALPSPVTALSILNKVASNQDEVRNMSAFVSTAVRNALPTPGKQELESAIALMEQARQLDEKAIRELQQKSTQVACNALGVLLQQTEGSVRNPSAYVCRNLQNDRRGPEDHPGLPYQGHTAIPPPRAAPPPPAPAFTGGLIPAARPLVEISPGGLEVLDGLLAKWRPSIDQQAWQSLMALDSMAVDILQELDQKADQIRSPSAYVQRAVGNAKAGHTPGRARSGHAHVPMAPMTIPAAPPPPSHGFPGGGGLGLAPHDEAPEVGNLFSEQASWSPSAFSRASNGDPGKANLISQPSEAFYGCEDVLRLLDEDAMRALDNLSEEAARKIVLQLSDQRSKVNNPSAYVMKAARNAQQDPPGASRLAMQENISQPPPMDGDGIELEEEIGQLSALLDEKAMSALHELPPSSAVHIVRKLRMQEAQVTNASAWVCKAVGNMKRPPPAAGGPEFAKRARV